MIIMKTRQLNGKFNYCKSFCSALSSSPLLSDGDCDKILTEVVSKLLLHICIKCYNSYNLDMDIFWSEYFFV